MQQRNILNVFIILIFLVAGGAILWQSFQPSDQPVDVFTTPMDTVTKAESAQSSPTLVEDAIPVEKMETAQEMTIIAKNFSYSQKEIRVKAGEKVTLTLQNDEGFHDLRIDELNAATEVIKAGESETIEFTPVEAGEYEYYCSVGEHRAMGMAGKLIVEE